MPRFTFIISHRLVCIWLLKIPTTVRLYQKLEKNKDNVVFQPRAIQHQHMDETHLLIRVRFWRRFYETISAKILG
jgi:hypothetical protein